MARKCLFLVQWEASRFGDVIEAGVLYMEAAIQTPPAEAW